MDILVEARTRAEAATEGMSDPELRRTAFEVILKHLLEQSSSKPSHPGAIIVSLASAGESRTIDQEREIPNPRSAAERVLSLKAEGFFQTGRGIGEIRDELQAHGWMYALTAISGPLMKLVRQRELRRMVSGDGKKNFKYFNP
jgi:hypothetical protein